VLQTDRAFGVLANHFYFEDKQRQAMLFADRQKPRALSYFGTASRKATSRHVPVTCTYEQLGHWQ
jgi:hypothetical protein